MFGAVRLTHTDTHYHTTTVDAHKVVSVQQRRPAKSIHQQDRSYTVKSTHIPIVQNSFFDQSDSLVFFFVFVRLGF